jgi:hypothetical protein
MWFIFVAYITFLSDSTSPNPLSCQLSKEPSASEELGRFVIFWCTEEERGGGGGGEEEKEK